MIRHRHAAPTAWRRHSDRFVLSRFEDRSKLDERELIGAPRNRDARDRLPVRLVGCGHHPPDSSERGHAGEDSGNEHQGSRAARGGNAAKAPEDTEGKADGDRERNSLGNQQDSKPQRRSSRPLGKKRRQGEEAGAERGHAGEHGERAAERVTITRGRPAQNVQRSFRDEACQNLQECGVTGDPNPAAPPDSAVSRRGLVLGLHVGKRRLDHTLNGSRTAPAGRPRAEPVGAAHCANPGITRVAPLVHVRTMRRPSAVGT